MGSVENRVGVVGRGSSTLTLTRTLSPTPTNKCCNALALNEAEILGAVDDKSRRRPLGCLEMWWSGSQVTRVVVSGEQRELTAACVETVQM